jgi:hypothetical protein
LEARTSHKACFATSRSVTVATMTLGREVVELWDELVELLAELD